MSERSHGYGVGMAPGCSDQRTRTRSSRCRPEQLPRRQERSLVPTPRLACQRGDCLDQVNDVERLGREADRSPFREGVQAWPIVDG